LEVLEGFRYSLLPSDQVVSGRPLACPLLLCGHHDYSSLIDFYPIIPGPFFPCSVSFFPALVVTWS
ncbi:unnamed protein product, partial [Amoebophrya sp. A25]